MKANTPDKIYISPKLEERTWLIGKFDVNAIEYIRTDAFIEKACRWLYLQLNGINMEGEDMENFLKDFKNYIKEE